MNFSIKLQNSKVIKVPCRCHRIICLHHLSTKFSLNFSNQRDSVGNTYSSGQFKTFENIIIFVDDLNVNLAHIIKIYLIGYFLFCDVKNVTNNS